MSSQSAYLYGAIIACEAFFWVVLGAALVSRYLLERTRTSRILLFCLPAVDLLLLLFTAFDLRSGTTADFAHGLATAYVGFTVAFAGVLVAWADRRFAHRFAGGPAPVPAPDRGWRAVRHEFSLWLRSVVAWAITSGLLVALIAFVDEPSRTEALGQWFRFAFGGVILWFLFGPGVEPAVLSTREDSLRSLDIAICGCGPAGLDHGVPNTGHARGQPWHPDLLEAQIRQSIDSIAPIDRNTTR